MPYELQGGQTNLFWSEVQYLKTKNKIYICHACFWFSKIWRKNPKEFMCNFCIKRYQILAGVASLPLSRLCADILYMSASCFTVCIWGVFNRAMGTGTTPICIWTGTLNSTYIGTTAKRVLWYVHYFFSSFKTGFYGYHLGKGDSKLIYALVALYWHFIVSLAHICIFPYTYMFRNIIY